VGKAVIILVNKDKEAGNTVRLIAIIITITTIVGTTTSARKEEILSRFKV
jgi:hypothetical protein